MSSQVHSPSGSVLPDTHPRGQSAPITDSSLPPCTHPWLALAGLLPPVLEEVDRPAPGRGGTGGVDWGTQG